MLFWSTGEPTLQLCVEPYSIALQGIQNLLLICQELPSRFSELFAAHLIH